MKINVQTIIVSENNELNDVGLRNTVTGNRHRRYSWNDHS